MTTREIILHRLSNQFLTKSELQTPSEIVKWFGAMQAQDYTGAKWGLGQRMQNATDTLIEDAFNKGEVLRTHVMRPTWHFVHPSDIRWMLELTAPRISIMLKYYNRTLGITDELLKKTEKIITKALEGKSMLTRIDIASELAKNNISAKGQMLGHIVFQAEIDRIICSGPRRGKQFTYMLLEERAPKANKMNRDEALAELTTRYFQSHGPATIKDFVWWSGLKTADARRGIETVISQLTSEIIEEKTYYFSSATTQKAFPHDLMKRAYLLPNYDEYGIAYTEREAFFNPKYNKLLNSRGNATFQHLIAYDGQMVGTWKRIEKGSTVTIETKFFTKASEDMQKAVNAAASQYGKFLGLEVKIT